MAKKRFKIKPMILLDAGHGKDTPGKRSPIWPDGSQYFEWKGNREIRDRVAKKLDDAGYGDRYKYVWHGEEDLSLKRRTDYINELAKHYGKQNTILFSIHSDAFTNPAAKGYSAFIHPNSSKGRPIAERWLNHFKEIFPDRSNRGVRSKKLAMTHNTICTAVLLENLFMTNQYECRNILMSDIGQDKIAHALFLTIVDIMEDKIKY